MPRAKKLTIQETLQKQRDDLAAKIGGIDEEINGHNAAVVALTATKEPLQAALSSYDLALASFAAPAEDKPMVAKKTAPKKNATEKMNDGGKRPLPLAAREVIPAATDVVPAVV